MDEQEVFSYKRSLCVAFIWNDGARLFPQTLFCSAEVLMGSSRVSWPSPSHTDV